MRRDTTPASAMFGQGTTPTLSMIVDGCDLTQAAVIYVTIEQRGRPQLNWTGDRVVTSLTVDGGTLLSVHLTQEETLSLKASDAEIQVRWLNPDNEAYITDINIVDINKALYKEVIEA